VTPQEIPHMIYARHETGTTFIACQIAQGTIEASIERNTLTVENITVHDSLGVRRMGLGSLLLRATIKGAGSCVGQPLEYIDFNIINPVMVPMLRKHFDDLVQFYADSEDRDTNSQVISSEYAALLAVQRQSQADQYNNSMQEYPSYFNPGIYARARLCQQLIQSWPMPLIAQQSYQTIF
jgi:hypothetical protein